jgi:hypothetical protein
MESIKENDEKWYEIVGFADKEDGWFQEYALSTTEDRYSDKYKPRTTYIHCIKGMPSETQLFNICLDKKDNPVLVISSDGEVLWKCIDIDTDQLSEKFTGGNISKLRSIILEADKTIEEYERQHPKFDNNKDHELTLRDIEFTNDGKITITFYGDNRKLNRNNPLYIGFEVDEDSGREHHYVFEVKKKNIDVHFPAYFSHSDVTPFTAYIYTATFMGYHTPSEEDVLSAKFRWVISEEIIKQAHKGACYL